MSITSGSSSPVQSWTVWPLRWRNHDPSRCHKLTTQWHSITSQETLSSSTQLSEPQISQHATYFIAVISKLCTVLLVTQVNKLWSSLQTCVWKVWFYCMHLSPCTQLYAAWSCKTLINFYSLHRITSKTVDVFMLLYFCTSNSKLSAIKPLTLQYSLQPIWNHIGWNRLPCSKNIWNITDEMVQ